jgi:hypothetical protein
MSRIDRVILAVLRPLQANEISALLENTSGYPSFTRVAALSHSTFWMLLK